MFARSFFSHPFFNLPQFACKLICSDEIHAISEEPAMKLFSTNEKKKLNFGMHEILDSPL